MLHDVEHLGHLREEQASVTAVLELTEQHVEPLELATVELH